MCYNNYVKINSQAFVNCEPDFILKTVFGYDDFRYPQKEIISSVLNKKDTLAIMPTGGGKSLCYQIPALIFEGITIVISPLISLMQDQVMSLKTTGIQSAFLNSSLSWEDFLQTVDEIKSGNVKIVYVSPEGIATNRIREILCSPQIKVSCITVDEAHCISSWGHDFRPDYLDICVLRNYFPDSVMLALTATATENVRKDIILNLKMKNPAIFISSFNRKNIFLEVQPKKNSQSQIVDYLKKHDGESGIIYCFSRKQVDQMTCELQKLGFSVLNYHAGLSDETRTNNQDLFIKDKVQIMVATVAFGMGINKPNVRFVINNDLPKSIEEYYQQIGRAGRDGLPSSALLLYSANDIHKIRYFFDETTDVQKAEMLLQSMVNFATTRICRRKALLSYFGENYEQNNADAVENDCCCDICKAGEIELTDVTIPVQKLLCCIIRTNQRFGTMYVVDVLLGSKSKRILDNGHNKISTWGIGKELSKDDWLELSDLLIFENYLRKTGDYNILEITEKGKKFLASKSELKLPFKKGIRTFAKKSVSYSSDLTNSSMFVAAKRIVAEKPSQNDAIAEKILENLKNWRKRKADDLNIPPFMIFGDKTLLDLAAKKPTNKNDLLNVYGIGKAKSEEFGRAIVQIIIDCAE